MQRASFVQTQFPSPGNLLTLNKIKESFVWKLTSTTTTICIATIHDLLLALSRDGETRRRQVVVCDRSDSGDDKHLEEARAPNPPRYLPTSTKSSALAAIPSDLPCWTSRGNASLAKSIEGRLGLGLGRHLGNLCTWAIRIKGCQALCAATSMSAQCHK